MLGLNFTILQPPVSIPLMNQSGILSPEWRQWFNALSQFVIKFQNAIPLPPMTTTQRDALNSQDGWMIYNTTIPSPQIKIAGVWTNFP